MCDHSWRRQQHEYNWSRYESSTWHQSGWWNRSWSRQWSSNYSSWEKPKKSVTFNLEPTQHIWFEDMADTELRKSVSFDTSVEAPPRKYIFVAIFRRTLLSCIRKVDQCFLNRAQSQSIIDSTNSEFVEEMVERERRILQGPWCSKKRRVITWDHEAQTCQEVDEIWNETIPNYYF